MAEVVEVVRHLLDQHLEAGLRMEAACACRPHQRRGLVAQQDVEQRRVRLHALDLKRQGLAGRKAQRRGVDHQVVAGGIVVLHRGHVGIEEGIELRRQAGRLAGHRVVKGDVLGAVDRAAFGQRDADRGCADAGAQDQHALAAKRNVVVIERAEQALAVEQIAFELVVFGAPHHVDRTGHTAEQAAAIEQVEHARLVRRRDDHAPYIARQKGRPDEHREIARRHLHGDQHRIDAEAREHAVEHARQAHVGDRIAGDQIRAGAAVEVDHLKCSGKRLSQVLVR